VGEAETASGLKKAVYWAFGTADARELPLLNPGDSASVALGINFLGEIVGEVELADGSRRGVLWQPDGSGHFGVTDLGIDGASANNDGTRIVGQSAGRSVVWDTRSLNMANSDPVTDGPGRAVAVNNGDLAAGVRGKPLSWPLRAESRRFPS